jgi:hypothetical protein
MVRFILDIILLSTLMISCTERPKSKSVSKNFTTLEISFSDGWGNASSFLIDSNKMYFSPSTLDSVRYGILPDSVFNVINTSILKIVDDTTVNSKDDGCVDCSLLAMKAIIKGDTLKIYQVGVISNILSHISESLQTFIRKSDHSVIHSVLFLETQKAVSPPPSPADAEKFPPPKQ